MIFEHDFLIKQQSNLHALITQEILPFVEFLLGSDRILQIINTEKKI